MNILISSIVRNRVTFLNQWAKQLNDLSELNQDINFYLSVYENDSIDGSKDFLKKIDFPLFKDYSLLSEDLLTNQHGSYKDAERVHLLADARNKSILNSPYLNIIDKVVSIEPDIQYNPEEMRKLLLSDYDIISARSIERHDDLSHHIYDSWATRKNEQDSSWDYSILLEGIMPVWTTFNCFCIYNAEAIRKGCLFSGHNHKINNFDCDTAVICELFRDNGYNNIVMDCDTKVFHSRV